MKSSLAAQCDLSLLGSKISAELPKRTCKTTIRLALKDFPPPKLPYMPIAGDLFNFVALPMYK